LTTDAPHRTTADEVRHHRARGVQAIEMEAAALFAFGRVRRFPVASAVVIDGVATEDGTSRHLDLAAAGKTLRQLLSVSIEFLANES